MSSEVQQYKQRAEEAERMISLLQKRMDALELKVEKAPSAAVSKPATSPAVEEKVSGPPSLRTRLSVKTIFEREKTLIGRTIGVGGWVRTYRQGGAGKFVFVKLYDGTTPSELQIFVEESVKGFEHVSKSCVAAAIFVIGEIVASKGKEQAIELKAQEVRLLGACDAETYPLAGKGVSLEHYRQNAHLRARGAIPGAVARVRSALAFATHAFYREQGFQYVHTPLITTSDCEGGGEMFGVTTLIDEHGKLLHKKPNGDPDFSKDFFKKPAYLTVSGQLNVETYCAGLSNVYTFGPTFRAENSHTSRHLAEFWMIEPEVAFADLEQNMDLAEAYIKYLIEYCLREHDADLALLEDFERRNLEQRKKDEAAAAKDAAKAAKDAKKAAQKEKTKGKSAGDGEAKTATPATKDTKGKDAAVKKDKVAREMSPEETDALKKVEEQAQVVRELKGRKAPKDEIDAAVAELLSRKATLKSLQPQKDSTDAPAKKEKEPKKAKAQSKEQQQSQKAPAGAKAAKEEKTAPTPDWRDTPLRQRLREVASAPFARVTYTEGIKLLQDVVAKGHKFEENNIEWGMDLASEHERYLCERLFKRPVMLHNYPKDIKAFYMRANDDGKTVAAVDILVPGLGELVGGSQREERLDVLLQRMKELKLKEEDYWWYLDLRRYGSVPHAGFGLGFGRMVCYVTGMENIRDIIPFPRYPGNATF